jgi:CRP-like cAMP-binding protein
LIGGVFDGNRGKSSLGSAYVTDTVSKYQRELSLLLSGSPIRRCKPGEIIFAEGDVSSRFYFIKKGKFVATFSNPCGNIKIVAIHAENTFIGDTALGGHRYYATVTALEESELYVIEHTHFKSCAMSHPEISFMIIDSLVRKARLAALQVEDLSLRMANQRVAHFLLELSNEIGREVDRGIALEERMTHETLANLTGLARPTLTGVLSELTGKGAITTKDHRFIILDKKRLADIADDISD